DAIRAARTSITYAQYFFAEGLVADHVVAALAERCRAGVAGHVLLDGVGTLSMQGRHIEELRTAGCDVRTFRALRPWALRGANNREATSPRRSSAARRPVEASRCTAPCSSRSTRPGGRSGSRTPTSCSTSG